MKTIPKLLWIACALGFGASAFAQHPTNPAAGTAKVGIYDSRALGYAWFWSEPGTKERNALLAAARSAKSAGDTERAKELGAQLSALQLRNHLQVFSTAPADEALAILRPKLDALQAELGVARLVSKWDDAALKDVPEAQRLDVTDRLVRELFTPDQRHSKVLESLKAKPPIPLEQARKLAESGKL